MNKTKFGKISHLHRGCLVFVVTFCLAITSLAAPPAQTGAQSGQQGTTAAGEVSQRQVDQMLLSAGAKHEIVKGLIEQGRFDRVLPEMRMIFALNLPDKEEDKIAQSASIIADMLVTAKQFALAHNVLDEAFARMNRNVDKASVLYIKAHVYASEGKVDKALETYSRAQALDKL